MSLVKGKTTAKEFLTNFMNDIVTQMGDDAGPFTGVFKGLMPIAKMKLRTMPEEECKGLCLFLADISREITRRIEEQNF